MKKKKRPLRKDLSHFKEAYSVICSVYSDRKQRLKLAVEIIVLYHQSNIDECVSWLVEKEIENEH